MTQHVFIFHFPLFSNEQWLLKSLRQLIEDKWTGKTKNLFRYFFCHFCDYCIWNFLIFWGVYFVRQYVFLFENIRRYLSNKGSCLFKFIIFRGNLLFEMGRVTFKIWNLHPSLNPYNYLRKNKLPFDFISINLCTDSVIYASFRPVSKLLFA